MTLVKLKCRSSKKTSANNKGKIEKTESKKRKNFSGKERIKSKIGKEKSDSEDQSDKNDESENQNDGTDSNESEETD